MSAEAQRVISISLSKIAFGRNTRGGLTLHKNLLVSSILNKARYVFMEETLQLIGTSTHPETERLFQEEIQHVGAAAPVPELLCDECPVVDDDDEDDDKENASPSDAITYLDLDTSEREVLTNTTNTHQHSNKRRRTVSDWETEEAVLSILPKKARTECSDDVDDEDDDAPSSMEIDHLTSLVSIFGFGGLVCDNSSALPPVGKLSRSVSTSDLCSAQANEGISVVQRPYLAMTV